MTTLRQFLENAKQRDSYWVGHAKNDFAVAIDRAIHRAGLSQKQIAERLGTSQAWITKALRGDANLTIESMVKLARAAGGRLHLHVAHEESAVRWFEIVESRKEQGICATTPLWTRHVTEKKNERLSLAA